MDINYLKEYVSYELHTIVRSWEHPFSPVSVPEVFCARRDLTDPYFTLESLQEILDLHRDSATKDSSSGDVPVMFSFCSQIFYAFIPSPEKDFLIGPFRFPSALHINLNLDIPAMNKKDIEAAPVCTLSLVSKNTLLLYNLFNEGRLSTNEFVGLNCIKGSLEDEVMHNYSDLVFDRQEQETHHNPYDQEIRECSSIERGDLKMLKMSIAEDYTGKLGILAKDEVRHMRNIGIVVITLASRAAIRGGMLPEVSYSMSDVFIQKLEETSDPAVITSMIRQFEFLYAQAVADLNKQKAGRKKDRQNTHIDQCKDYIFRHLHDKIRVQDIADELYLNANYLSEIFKEYEGVTISEFILNEKIALTKNLLTYSPYSYIDIAAYLGFSSQSHLGKVFKKQTGMTLRQYREQYERKEF